MARVRGRIASDEGAQGRVSDPVKQAGAKYAGSETTLAGDDQHTTRA